MKTLSMSNGKEPKRYRIKSWELGEKMRRSPAVVVCSTDEWKDRVLRASQKKKMSLSAFVREAVNEKLETCGA